MEFKYLFIDLILLFSLFFFTGCDDARGIETNAYVVAIGIDEIENNDIKLTFQFELPDSSNSAPTTNSSSTIISVKSSTIDAGISLINNYISKKVNLSHCKAIVFSEITAYNGLAKYIYTFANNIQIRPDCYIMISRCNASSFLSTFNPNLESVATRYYELILDSNEYTGYIEPIYLADFYNNILSTTVQPIAILSGINSKNLEQTSLKKEENYKANETPINAQNNVENLGLAVFVGDTLVGELDNINTLAHMIVSNKLKNATITIRNPFDDTTNISIYINLFKNTKNTVTIINDYPYITCNCYITGYILSLDKNLDLSNNDVLKTINNAVTSYLEYIISSYLYTTAKDFHSDIDNFGKYVLPNYLTLPQWQKSDWLNNYKNSFFNVNVQTNILSGYLFNKF